MRTAGGPGDVRYAHDRVQHAVAELAARIGKPVLVENAGSELLWSSTPDGSAVGSSLTALSRWSVPVRHGSVVLGHVCVVDPQGSLSVPDVDALTRFAENIVAVLRAGAVGSASRAGRRTQLLARLAINRDAAAAAELIAAEGLPVLPTVVANAPAREGEWAVTSRVSVRVAGRHHVPATSGRPLPLIDLGQAVFRAQMTDRVVHAGGRLRTTSWDDLGSWRFVVEAPESVSPPDIHRGVAVLRRAVHTELAATTRAFLECGGDSVRAAHELHLHRTTLHYRLQKVETLIDVDLKNPRDRWDLLMALRLDAFRDVVAAEAT